MTPREVARVHGPELSVPISGARIVPLSRRNDAQDRAWDQRAIGVAYTPPPEPRGWVRRLLRAVGTEVDVRQGSSRFVLNEETDVQVNSSVCCGVTSTSRVSCERSAPGSSYDSASSVSSSSTFPEVLSCSPEVRRRASRLLPSAPLGLAGCVVVGGHVQVLSGRSANPSSGCRRDCNGERARRKGSPIRLRAAARQAAVTGHLAAAIAPKGLSVWVPRSPVVSGPGTCRYADGDCLAWRDSRIRT